MAETKEQQLEWKVSDKAEENSANTTPQDKESIDQKKKKAKKPMVTRAELQKFKTQHGESVDWKGFSSAQIILKKDAIDVLEFETSIVGGIKPQSKDLWWPYLDREPATLFVSLSEETNNACSSSPHSTEVWLRLHWHNLCVLLWLQNNR